MEQVSFLKEIYDQEDKPSYLQQSKGGLFKDCSKKRIPCMRPCRVVDGIRYLIYSNEEQNRRLKIHRKASSQAVCEHCRKEVRSLDIYWRFFGLCSWCYEKGENDSVEDCIIGSSWEKPGGRVN